MLKEAIEKILELGTPQRHTVHGLEYTSRKLLLVEPPTPPTFSVHTLDGLVNLL